jgi:hypothetical protein
MYPRWRWRNQRPGRLERDGAIGRAGVRRTIGQRSPRLLISARSRQHHRLRDRMSCASRTGTILRQKRGPPSVQS